MTPWGLAKIEVIASKEHIARELQRGVPVKQIHNALAQSGRVSVTYNSFRRQIQAVRSELEALSTDRKPEPYKRAPHSSKRPTTENEVPQKQPGEHTDSDFHFDPSCTVEDFF